MLTCEPQLSDYMTRPKVEYVQSKRGGRQLVRDGYRYHMKRRNKYGYVTWRCIHRGVCNAYCVVDSDSRLMKDIFLHTCPAKGESYDNIKVLKDVGSLSFIIHQKEYITGDDEVLMIPTRKKYLMMVNGYTYYQINYSGHWVCSTKARTKCKARFHQSPKGQIIHAVSRHTHPPEPKSIPNYISNKKLTMMSLYLPSHEKRVRQNYGDKIVTIPTRGGKFLLMINGYTYSHMTSVYWYCSSKSQGYTKIKRQDENEFIKIPTPGGKFLLMVERYTYSAIKDEIIKIPTPGGKFLMMLDGYTYSQYRDVYWYCSSKFQGCKARVRYTGDEVVKVMTDHTHPPPKYYCKNGVYIKL
ncbi:unnamed protein product [Pieris brassicae]|uniref:FLYWCH-type domain-containing protein n=1 Tax=Pieris brassicae TaxID=7116 RepID=A0A9P0WZU5_PIEBR|nr:unnamed protein product [Pieris brassicae]